MECWSKINCGFWIADCRLKYQECYKFKIRNPQSAIRNLICSNTPNFIFCLQRVKV
jgi:hypothetical protein